ncbi:MAG: hypothetical protein ACKV2O_06085 [Acidimicrobiales bacterium]
MAGAMTPPPPSILAELGEHQDPSPASGQRRHVVNDHPVANLVVGESSEHVLDVRAVLVQGELGGVHVQLAAELGAGYCRGGDLVTDRSAIERDKRVKAIGPERRGRDTYATGC